MKTTLLFFTICIVSLVNAQDLSQGYIANDLNANAMQPLSKPGYLSAVNDPTFTNTLIRRISDVGAGNVLKPMYSTIQAWNADESLMILYRQGMGHQLHDGTDYTFIRNLTDINADDIETIFWHFTDPNVFFYLENTTDDFISYNVNTQVKTIIVNLDTVSGCGGSISLGNDVQMMSWDSDVISFRCNNDSAFYYRISTGTTTQFNITSINYTAPMPFPSGNLFYHNGSVYDSSGNFVRDLNLSGTEHSCLGKLSNGDDAYFAIAFEQGPNGGCQGTLVAHNATNGDCYSITPVANYTYPQSGTHISSLAHNNSEDGWVAVSCMGYDLDGQDILDQELFIAKAGPTSADVYRVAHHRSDENEFDYWGEPHVTISPSGTRLLFGSDWSGVEDGTSVEAYVAELSAHTLSIGDWEILEGIKIYPSPVLDVLNIVTENNKVTYKIHAATGQLIEESGLNIDKTINVSGLPNGLYFITLFLNNSHQTLKFVK